MFVGWDILIFITFLPYNLILWLFLNSFQIQNKSTRSQTTRDSDSQCGHFDPIFRTWIDTYQMYTHFFSFFICLLLFVLVILDHFHLSFTAWDTASARKNTSKMTFHDPRSLHWVTGSKSTHHIKRVESLAMLLILSLNATWTWPCQTHPMWRNRLSS